MPAELINRLKNVRAFVLDFDGVFTNGEILLLEDGEWLRQMHIRDTFALTHAIEKRYRICVISEKGSEAIGMLFERLGVKDIYYDVENKLAILEKFVIDHELDIQHVMYVGDDIPDLPALKAAGFAACPQDAVPEVKHSAHYITEAKGGQGCVREVVEMVLKVHENWKF